MNLSILGKMTHSKSTLPSFRKCVFSEYTEFERHTYAVNHSKSVELCTLRYSANLKNTVYVHFSTKMVSNEIVFIVYYKLS